MVSGEWRAGFFGEHISEDFLHCHCVTAGFPLHEELATATPFSIDVAGEVSIVSASEIYTQVPDIDSIFLPGVAVGFFNSADKIGTHLNSFSVVLFYHNIHQTSGHI